jgi:hypothetical protein
LAEATLEVLGEQMRRMLDAQGAMRGDLTARAIEATRQQMLAQVELARIDELMRLEAIEKRW